jgi:6-phosphofructokinase 1
MNFSAHSDLTIETLGECNHTSPLAGRRTRFVKPQERVIQPSLTSDLAYYLSHDLPVPGFELAGAREKIFFDPSIVRCGVITCGGLCPGLNHVIRSVTLTALETYKVQQVLGFRYGFSGLSANSPMPPIDLNSDSVRNIQDLPGTILGSSRGPQSPSEMVDTLQKYGINMLFTIGGEGTLQGASLLVDEIKKRKLPIAVVSIPKTIDNDLSCIERSFGFATAVEAAKEVLNAAHAEASSAYNGVGLVKLMGRHSGFIAAHATLATANVNFCLVPELPFELDMFLEALEQRLRHRSHAVIVVGEGAGQDLIEGDSNERDPSGNVRLKDIGSFLLKKINDHFKNRSTPLTIKYIDPSYTIRSLPANAVDSEFCVLLGQCAVHAAMAGCTNMVIGSWNQHFTHIPNRVVVKTRKQLNLMGETWQTILEITHQPFMTTPT